MARRGLKPVSIAGIEFDALIEETKTLSATVPVYPVENGFPVSDTIILDPLRIQMTLYVTNTPVTWLYRHGSSKDRVRRICEALESLWLDRRLVKIVTSDTIYTNMGITSLTIKKSRETGYAREVSLAAQKVRVTDRETTQIPDYILKSGETQANAGTASTSSSPSRTGGEAAGSSGGSQGGDSSDGAGSDSPAKKSQSMLFGVASGMDWI